MKARWGLLLAGLFAIIIVFQIFSFRLNEDLAIQTMTRIGVAQKRYWEDAGRHKYGDLRDLVALGLLDKALADGSDHGYIFEIRYADDHYFYASAKPARYGNSSYWGTGALSVFVDTSGKARAEYKNGEDLSPDDFPDLQRGK